MLSFEHQYDSNVTDWSGYVYYEELKSDASQQQIWKTNRKQIYANSLTHFIRALYQGTLQEEGFLLSYIHRLSSGKYTCQIEDGRNILFADSVTNGKVLYIHPDSTLLLTCFGKPVTAKHIRQHEKYMGKVTSQAQLGVYRNTISTVGDKAYIFPDGTCSDILNVSPFRGSFVISGLNMMLPIEYGLIQDVSVPPDETQVDHPEIRPFVSDMNDLMQDEYPEKIYLTTDRSYYAAGDTIWLSAWVLNGGTLEPTDKSRMLHVELISPDNSIFRHLVLENAQGVAFGQVVLPAGISGDALFRIRAYTRWSLNFNENYRFEKPIPVLQFKDDIWKEPQIVTSDELRVTGQVADSLVTRHSSLVTDMDLQFLPEGGRWVAGFPCRMAFKSVATDGRGVNVEGEIVDDQGKIITSFRSLHQGMGSVFLVPQPGRKYQARLFSGHTVDLPVPDTSGVVMSLQPVRNDSLDLQLYFPPEIVDRNEIFKLVAQSRGVYAAAWEIPAYSTHVAMRLPMEQLQTGIARFALFTKEGIPCNERLVFVDKEDEIQLKVKPLPPAPSPKGRGSVLPKGTRSDSLSTFSQNIGDIAIPLSLGEGMGVRLLLQAMDSDGFPIQGVFTVSVTDNLYDNYDSREANLRSQMLLSADLSGKVENPGWYFQDKDSLRRQALDLVMRTHGWGGYSWKEVRKQQEKLLYNPEIDYTVSGTVTDLRNKSKKGVPVVLWVEGVQSIFKDTLTDAQGRFRFNGLQFWDNTHVFVQAIPEKTKKDALDMVIKLDPQSEMRSPAIRPLTTSSGKEEWEEFSALYRQQKQSDKHWSDSLLTEIGNNVKEVAVAAKRPVKGSCNLNGPGQADRVLYEEDIARYDKNERLLDVVKAEIPQLQQVPWFNDEILRTIYYSSGAPSDYTVWHFQNRPVAFILNGKALRVDIPAEDKLTRLPRVAMDEDLLLLAKSFWNIPAKDIVGIEVLDSPDYLWPYITNPKFTRYLNCPMCIPSRIYSDPNRLLIIEITTRSGNINMEDIRIGAVKLKLPGFATPKVFYVPKYYPDNIADQIEYNVKPVLYWNPEVVTDKNGKAEINFPVGPWQQKMQIRIEGTDLKGRIGSITERD